jgi:glycosyltransferase involved in cell wall biosynthesis
VPFLPLFWLYEFAFLLKSKARIYHACDLDTLFPAIIASRITRAKLFYSIIDFYANNIPTGSFGRAGILARRVIGMLEKIGIGLTDVVALADEARREEIGGARPKKVLLLYNSPEDTVGTSDMEPTVEQRELVVFYAGVLLKDVRGIEQMIEAVNRVDGVRLILAGSGPDESYFRELARRTDRVQFIGWIPRYDDLLSEELKSDVLFRFSDPMHPKTKYESPTKLFEAMMCGKPIIVSDGSSMAAIVREEKCGIVVQFGDVPATGAAVLELMNDAQLREQLGKNGRNAYDLKYSWAIMEARLLDAYATL